MRNVAGVVRNLTTLSYNKFGPPSQVLVAGVDADVKTLGSNEVALKFLAAPITSSDLASITGGAGGNSSFPAVAGTQGIAVVTGIGSGVNSLKINDWVVPIAANFGKYNK